ncbi:MAG TPA: hypothetical protein VMV77_04760 [Bacteroidales bacterium]|nr:hypothetical protein [Bacteroidales bacterium]
MEAAKLERLNACRDAVLWVKTQTSIKEAWENCERGDWMLWLAKRLNIDDKKLTMAKAMCAKQVEHLMKDKRSKDALPACFDYVNGKITRKQLTAYAAFAAAAFAAVDAAFAAAAAADADADADAAFAAAYAAAYADDDDAKKSSLKKSAGICRKYLTEEVLTKYRKLRI